MKTELESHSGKNARRNLFVFLGLFAFFFIVFIQYPLSGALTGNTDTWYNLSIFNDYGNRILAFFTGNEIGNAIYPETINQIFAEPYLGEAATYLFWKIFFIPDLWAYFLFIVTTYALNGFGAFLLLKTYVKSFWPAVAIGFAFAASTFSFSQVELLNGIGWSTALFCLYFFHRYLKEGRWQLLAWSMFFGGIQIYSSAYVFVYQCAFLVLMVLFNAKLFLEDKKRMQELGIGILGMAVLMFPFAWLYVFDSMIGQAWNPFADDPSLIENFNLKPSDLIRSFENNLIYPQIKHIEYDTLMRNHNYANIGILIYGLAIFGFLKMKENKLFWGIVAFLGLMFAFGPSVDFGAFKIPTPLHPLYYHTGIINFLRIPARAFSLFVLAIGAFAAFGLKALVEKWQKYAWLLAIGFMIVFTIENVPTSFHKIDALRFINPPERYQEYLSEKAPDEVVANLPSGLFTETQHYIEGVSVFSREYIYGHWQTKHKINTLNGSCGYFPDSRLRNNDLMKDIDSGNNLELLILENGVDYIAHHQNFILSDKEEKVLSFLRSSPLLQEEWQENNVAMFKVRKP